MIPRVRLTPRALADLRDIGRYTERQWGRAQRDSYLRAIDARMHWLAQQPRRGRHRPDIAPDYHCFGEGMHLIFYLIRDGGIDIIGIPHQAMDIAGHLETD